MRRARVTGIAALACGCLLTASALGGAHRKKAPAAPPTKSTIVIHAGTLLAVPGEPPAGNSTLLVRGDRIERIEGGLLSPAELGEPDAIVRDLSDHFVLPGLMDAHVHLVAQPSMFMAAARGGRITPSVIATFVSLHAQRTLAAGFTTVRDVGSNDESVFAVRDAINRGDQPGPRILASGPVVTATGGHDDRGRGETKTLDPDVRLKEGVCDGVDECTQTVRHLKKIGADLIKFTATGGFMSNTGTEQQYDADEMAAIIATAHQRGMRVAAHAYAADAIRVAVEAGVDSIEHGWLLDDAAIRAMKNSGTWLVPTLLISRPSDWSQLAGIDPDHSLRDDARAFEKAYAAGVNIAFGTDVGIYDHGQNALEFGLMVELGMSPADAIHSATISTARLFGLEAETGSLEPGKLADIIAVRGNPLDDIEALYAVDFVMKSGRIVKVGGRYVGTAQTRPVGEAVAF